MNEDIFKTLRDCKELVNLEDAEIKQLAGVAKLVDYEAGHEVFFY